MIKYFSKLENILLIAYYCDILEPLSILTHALEIIYSNFYEYNVKKNYIQYLKNINNNKLHIEEFFI